MSTLGSCSTSRSSPFLGQMLRNFHNERARERLSISIFSMTLIVKSTIRLARVPRHKHSFDVGCFNWNLHSIKSSMVLKNSASKNWCALMCFQVFLSIELMIPNEKNHRIQRKRERNGRDAILSNTHVSLSKMIFNRIENDRGLAVELWAFVDILIKQNIFGIDPERGGEWKNLSLFCNWIEIIDEWKHQIKHNLGLFESKNKKEAAFWAVRACLFVFLR